MKIEWIKIDWDDNKTTPNETNEIRLAYKFKNFNTITEGGTLFYIGNKEFRTEEGYLYEMDITESTDIWWCYAPVFKGVE